MNYIDWVIEKSLKIESRGGNWNLLKAEIVFFGGALLPIMVIIFGFDFILHTLGGLK